MSPSATLAFRSVSTLPPFATAIQAFELVLLLPGEAVDTLLNEIANGLMNGTDEPKTVN